MENKKTLIETFLPVEEISAEAKREKNGRAPTFELHYWWTRKPLIVARATVLGALLPEDFDLVEFKHMLGLRDNQKIRAHNYQLSKGQIDNLNKSIKFTWGPDPLTILDPFAGGGSIPFEALKLGCNIISNDYNPVSFLIQKTTIEYPSKYGESLQTDVENGLKWIFSSAENQLKNLYPKHNDKDVASYIYAWMAHCPGCGFKNPLVSQWWLVKKPNKKLYLNPIVDENRITFTIESGNKAPEGTINRGKGKCLKCGTVIPNEHIVKEINQNKDEILLAVVLQEKKGKTYDLPNSDDFKAIKYAKSLLNENWDELIKEDCIPTEEIPYGDVRSAKYLKYWYNLFNPRQLFLFANLIRLIREYGNQVKISKDFEYSTAIVAYLSLILGKHIDYNCRSTTWHRTAEKMVHALTTRSPGMMWEHVEVNPFIKSSGTLIGINKSIIKSLDYSIKNLKNENKIEITNNSILESKFNSKIIITDPPYFDDVVYAELSEFFYVFEKRALKDFFKLPIEAPKSEDLSVGRKRPKEVFEQLFSNSCKKMLSFLDDDGILAMYFAHSSVEAWDFVVRALTSAGFRITATWPIHTESPNSPIAKDKASILSSIIIIARKRNGKQEGYIEEIKDEIQIHLREKLQEFWNLGLRGADLTVAAMGATLDVLTQYSVIKSYTGKMTVKDILELVELYVVEYILEKFLKNSESLDSHTRFYAYCRLSELDGMSFDTANLISKSLNIDLKLLESNGNIASITKGRNKGVKILKYDERDEIEVKNLIDAVQLGMLSYDKGGMREFESILTDVPYSQSEIFNILESFKYLDSSDPEKQIAMQILGKSSDLIPEKGQTTLK